MPLLALAGSASVSAGGAGAVETAFPRVDGRFTLGGSFKFREIRQAFGVSARSGIRSLRRSGGRRVPTLAVFAAFSASALAVGIFTVVLAAIVLRIGFEEVRVRLLPFGKF